VHQNGVFDLEVLIHSGDQYDRDDKEPESEKIRSSFERPSGDQGTGTPLISIVTQNYHDALPSSVFLTTSRISVPGLISR
jgi:hypothetical protein